MEECGAARANRARWNDRARCGHPTGSLSTDAERVPLSHAGQRRGSGKDLRAAVRWRADLHADGRDILRASLRDASRPIRYIVDAVARASVASVTEPRTRTTVAA